MSWGKMVFYILLGIAYLAYALCKQEKIEKVIFENERPGYLYNIGAKAYIGKKAKESEDGAVSLIGIVGSPEKAIRFRISHQNIYGISFSNILLDNKEKEYSEEWNNYSDQDQRYWKDFSSSSRSKALSQINIGARARYTLIPLKQKNSYHFSFSPAIYPKQNAFQIYTKGGCLSIDMHGLLSFESCINTETPRKKKQLFRWVNAEWYNAGMHQLNNSE